MMENTRLDFLNVLLANHLRQIAPVSLHDIETFQFLDSGVTPIIGDSASNGATVSGSVRDAVLKATN